MLSSVIAASSMVPKAAVMPKPRDATAAERSRAPKAAASSPAPSPRELLSSRTHRPGSGVFVPALGVARDPLHLFGRDERSFTDPGAALGHRTLPGGAVEVLSPEGPRAALLGARGVDRAAVPRVEERTGGIVDPQGDPTVFFLAVAVQEGLPIELQVPSQGLYVGFRQVHEGVLVVGPTAVAALGALEVQPLVKPGFEHEGGFLGAEGLLGMWAVTAQVR